MMKDQWELQDENERLLRDVFDLRRRLENTEDALMRANRWLMKPIAVECAECGEKFYVARPPEKVNALA